MRHCLQRPPPPSLSPPTKFTYIQVARGNICQGYDNQMYFFTHLLQTFQTHCVILRAYRVI